MIKKLMAALAVFSQAGSLAFAHPGGVFAGSESGWAHFFSGWEHPAVMLAVSAVLVFSTGKFAKAGVSFALAAYLFAHAVGAGAAFATGFFSATFLCLACGSGLCLAARKIAGRSPVGAKSRSGL